MSAFSGRSFAARAAGAAGTERGRADAALQRGLPAGRGRRPSRLSAWTPVRRRCWLGCSAGCSASPLETLRAAFGRGRLRVARGHGWRAAGGSKRCVSRRAAKEPAVRWRAADHGMLPCVASRVSTTEVNGEFCTRVKHDTERRFQTVVHENATSRHLARILSNKRPKIQHRTPRRTEQNTERQNRPLKAYLRRRPDTHS